MVSKLDTLRQELSEYKDSAATQRSHAMHWEMVAEEAHVEATTLREKLEDDHMQFQHKLEDVHSRFKKYELKLDSIRRENTRLLAAAVERKKQMEESRKGAETLQQELSNLEKSLDTFLERCNDVESKVAEMK